MATCSVLKPGLIVIACCFLTAAADTTTATTDIPFSVPTRPSWTPYFNDSQRLDSQEPTRNELKLCCGPCCHGNGSDITMPNSPITGAEKEKMHVRFVRDMVNNLSWESLFIIYDSEQEDLIQALTSDFATNRTQITYQLVLSDVEQSDTYILSSITESLRKKDSLDAVLICSLPCILRILETALSLEKEFKRRVSVIQSTRWLLVPSGDEEVPIFNKIFALGFDNIAVVSSPNLLSEQFVKSQALGCSDLVLSTLLWKEGNRRELSPVGNFCRDKGATIQNNIFPNSRLGFNGRHFLVSTMLWDPYMMKEETNGSYRYYGLCADLLDELARTLNFTYTLSEPDDLMWGHNNSGVWSGLVGQLHRQEIDLTMAPLAMTREREVVMDFTFPFYHDFSGVLLKRPDPNATKWRVYIDIFRWEVLLSLAGALVGGCFMAVSIEMAERKIFGRGPLWSSVNTIWVVLGALLSQGCRRLPRRGSGRMFLSAWWLFSIILAATYSGNLIAFLTVTKDKAPFDTLDQMVRQDQYRYGTIDQSMWTMLFEFSNTPTYKAIHENIHRFKQDDPRVLSTDPQVHLQMVREGGYAYIADTGMFSSWLATNCDLMLIKEKFYPATYAAGLPNDSAYTKLFSDQIMKIYESGLLQVWINRWWPKRNFCGGSLTTEARALTLVDTQSVFYLVGVGFGLSALVLGAEWMWRTLRRGCCPYAHQPEAESPEKDFS